MMEQAIYYFVRFTKHSFLTKMLNALLTPLSLACPLSSFMKKILCLHAGMYIFQRKFQSHSQYLKQQHSRLSFWLLFRQRILGTIAYCSDQPRFIKRPVPFFSSRKLWLWHQGYFSCARATYRADFNCNPGVKESTPAWTWLCSSSYLDPCCFLGRHRHGRKNAYSFHQQSVKLLPPILLHRGLSRLLRPCPALRCCVCGVPTSTWLTKGKPSWSTTEIVHPWIVGIFPVKSKVARIRESKATLYL